VSIRSHLKKLLKLSKKAKKELKKYGILESGRSFMKENLFASYSGWKFGFKKQDGWIGYYYQIDPCTSSQNQFNIWICLFPFFPLHLWWLISKRNEK